MIFSKWFYAEIHCRNLEGVSAENKRNLPKLATYQQISHIFIGAFISNLVRKFFLGRMRATVVRSAGNSLKVVTYVHNRRCLAGLFLETWGCFDTIRFPRFVAIDLLLSHIDL